MVDAQRSLPPFHLALAVADLNASRRFYGGLLGCREGRSAGRWVDFDFFGHQLVAHQVAYASASVAANEVDGHEIPVPHFGVVLSGADWHGLERKLRDCGVAFAVEPHTRFAGTAGEQSTLFIRDPDGHLLEFKALADPARLFTVNAPLQP